jgi:hypothetical protein
MLCKTALHIVVIYSVFKIVFFLLLFTLLADTPGGGALSLLDVRKQWLRDNITLASYFMVKYVVAMTFSFSLKD